MTAIPERTAARDAQPVDLALMLALWRTGRPECRDVALEMADRDRKAARPDPKSNGLEAA